MVVIPHGNPDSPVALIDPHLHLFNLAEGDYYWLQPDSAPYWEGKQNIRRSWLESDLQLPAPLQLSGFVHIEAGFDNRHPWREVAWLEQHCQLPFRSIGFADLTAADFESTLAQLNAYSSVAGIRNILGNNAAVILNNPRVNENLSCLAEAGMLLELQLNFTDRAAVDRVCELAGRWPQLVWIFNHAGLSLTATKEWKTSVRQLAALPNIYVKCSGWEMLQRDWQQVQVVPLLKVLLQQFGEQRLMLASNFPVSELAMSYEQLWQGYVQLCSEQLPAALLYDNARRLYGFTES